MANARVNYTSEQLDCLEEVFTENSRPSLKDFKKLQSLIGIDFKKIQIWFQNRRAKERKQAKKGLPQDPLKQMRKALCRNATINLPIKTETTVAENPPSAPVAQQIQLLFTMDIQQVPNTICEIPADTDGHGDIVRTMADESVSTTMSWSSVIPEEDALLFAKMFNLESPKELNSQVQMSIQGRKSSTLVRLSICSFDGNNCPEFQTSAGSLSSIASPDFREIAKFQSSFFEKLEDDVFSPVAKRGFLLPSYVNNPNL